PARAKPVAEPRLPSAPGSRHVRAHARGWTGGTASSRDRSPRGWTSPRSAVRYWRRGSAAAGAAAVAGELAADPARKPARAASDRAPPPRPALAGRSVYDRAARQAARAATGSPDQDLRSGRSPRGNSRPRPGGPRLSGV